MTLRPALCVAAALVGCGPGVHPHVAPVLEAPTAFAIDVEGSTGLGRVTDASLSGDSLAVRYAYPALEGERTGTMAGVLDGPILTGTYDTRGPGTHFRGPLRLTFAPDGDASGVWNDGEGTVALFTRRRVRR